MSNLEIGDQIPPRLLVFHEGEPYPFAGEIFLGEAIFRAEKNCPVGNQCSENTWTLWEPKKLGISTDGSTPYSNNWASTWTSCCFFRMHIMYKYNEYKVSIWECNFMPICKQNGEDIRRLFSLCGGSRRSSLPRTRWTGHSGDCWRYWLEDPRFFHRCITRSGGICWWNFRPVIFA